MVKEKLVASYTCEATGITVTYTYRGSSIVSGIEKSELEYPKGYLEQFAKQEKYRTNLPKTKQLFLNPATGREVSYARAKALKII